MTAHTPGPLNPVEGERMHPRTETPYTLNLAFATKEERATASRLIAAAPELLEALVEAIRIDEDEPCGSDSGYQQMLNRWRTKARAAIAKAKGEHNG